MSLKVVITNFSTDPPSTTDVLLNGSELQCSDASLLEFLNKKGVVGYDGKAFFPKDGKAFMNALQVEFSGSFVRASAPVES